MKIISAWSELEVENGTKWFQLDSSFLTRLQFWQLYKNSEIRSFLEGDILVAGLCFKQLSEGLWEVLFVGCAPDYRRKGYVSQLLESWFQELSVGEVWLEVAASNSKALKLYKKLGFTRNSKRLDYYGPGEDCWNMSKNLS